MKNSQATKEEVNAFLKEFKERAKLFDIVYVDSKPNNIDTLTALDITLNDRKNYVLSLETEDYCQGPDKNDYPDQNDVWVFGKQIKGQEVYLICSIIVCIEVKPIEPSVPVSSVQ